MKYCVCYVLLVVEYIYISQEIYNLTTPWQPFLIQSTPTPFQSTKTRSRCIPHKCKCWCISNNLSPTSLLKIAGLSDLSQKRSRHAVKTSNGSYHTKPYISQEIYNLTTPWQPFLIQSTPTPFQFTKTRKPDYVLKYE